MALGLGAEPVKRLRVLMTPDGLRFAILEHAFNLKIKGVPTPARLREALAAAALERAFGDKSTAGLAGKLGLSAKAGRLLAAQLSRKPRDFGTDTRLIAALAAEQVGASSTDPEALRLALLRRFFTVAPTKTSPVKRPVAKRPAVAEPAPLPTQQVRAVPPALPAQPAVQVPSGRPDLAGFRHRGAPAGSRRSAGLERQPQGLHQPRVAQYPRASAPTGASPRSSSSACWPRRTAPGQLALANADLKDKSNIKDVQESAVVYQERRVPLHPRRRLTAALASAPSELRFHAPRGSHSAACRPPVGGLRALHHLGGRHLAGRSRRRRAGACAGAAQVRRAARPR